MVQFLSIKFFVVGFLNFFLDFSNVPVFLGHPVYGLPHCEYAFRWFYLVVI
jgi:hypothetical protein